MSEIEGCGDRGKRAHETHMRALLSSTLEHEAKAAAAATVAATFCIGRNSSLAHLCSCCKLPLPSEPFRPDARNVPALSLKTRYCTVLYRFRAVFFHEVKFPSPTVLYCRV